MKYWEWRTYKHQQGSLIWECNVSTKLKEIYLGMWILLNLRYEVSE